MSVDLTNPDVSNQANVSDNVSPDNSGEDISNPLDNEYRRDLYDRDGTVLNACDEANREALNDMDLSEFPTVYIDDLDNDDQLLGNADDTLNVDEERLDEISAQLASKGIVDKTGMIAAAEYNDRNADQEVQYARRRVRELEESRQQNLT